MGKGLMDGSCLLLAAGRHHGIRILIQISRVLIVVAVETQQFPVAPVGRIVVVVVIFVMDRELAKFLALEFAPTARADPGVNLERLLPITLLSLLAAAAGLSDNPVHLIFV